MIRLIDIQVVAGPTEIGGWGGILVRQYLKYAEGMDFKITDQAYKFVSASRKSAGIYEVKTIEYDGDNMMATYTINAIQMFADEDVFRRQCNDACPEKMQSRITVNKAVKKLT